MNRSGFTLIEIIVGMLIFAMGVLALTASMGAMGLQLQSSNLRTERDASFQQATELLYTVDFDALTTKAPADALTIGEYDVWWDVQTLSWTLKQVHVYSEGPAFRDRARHSDVVDTLTIRIARP